MRILVVEDEEDLARAIAMGLREGYAVDLAFDGLDALEKLSTSSYDLACIDLALPGMDGRELCRSLRTDPELRTAWPRVLMVTARDGLDDRVAGLDDGADDYLVKPFHFSELAARVRALLRRPPPVSAPVLRVGDLELDDARHEAMRAGRPLDLSLKEFALLRYFMSRPGEVISQEKLLEHVWDENADLFSSSRVRVAIMGLRRKLAENQPIRTVVGRGYRLADGA